MVEVHLVKTLYTKKNFKTIVKTKKVHCFSIKKDNNEISENYLLNLLTPQPVFTCSTSTMVTADCLGERDISKVNNKDTITTSMTLLWCLYC